MIGSRKLKLEFSVNWLVCIIILAVGLITAYILCPAWNDQLKFSAAVIAGAAAMIAAANALDARQAGVDQAKKSTSLDFVHRWNDPLFFHAKKNGREIILHLKTLRTPADQKAYLEEDPTRLANILDVLNFFEAMGVAIQTDIADEETARRFFRSVAVEYWHSTADFIQARRADKQNMRLGQELEWLFKQWKS